MASSSSSSSDDPPVARGWSNGVPVTYPTASSPPVPRTEVPRPVVGRQPLASALAGLPPSVSRPGTSAVSFPKAFDPDRALLYQRAMSRAMPKKTWASKGVTLAVWLSCSRPSCILPPPPRLTTSTKTLMSCFFSLNRHSVRLPDPARRGLWSQQRHLCRRASFPSASCALPSLAQPALGPLSAPSQPTPTSSHLLPILLGGLDKRLSSPRYPSFLSDPSWLTNLLPFPPPPLPTSMAAPPQSTAKSGSGVSSSVDL